MYMNVRIYHLLYSKHSYENSNIYKICIIINRKFFKNIFYHIQYLVGFFINYKYILLCKCSVHKCIYVFETNSNFCIKKVNKF